MRTAIRHRKSRVSSAIFVQQNLKSGFPAVAVVQWVRRWTSGHRVVQAEGSSQGGDIYEFFFSNDFYFSFVRPNGLQ